MTTRRAKLPPPETLVAATFFLMTRHATIRCPLVGRVIARQLQFLADHPSETLTPQLRDVCAKLSVQWTREAEESERNRLLADASLAPHRIH
ncbi:MAG TPA: hypothetical protein VHB46_12565 [Burkholderiales bacterium]|nr:hypothetical protein [Burkholderiales bacterium]